MIEEGSQSEESRPLVSALNCLALIPLLSGDQNNPLLLKNVLFLQLLSFQSTKKKEREHKMLPLTLIKQCERNFSNDDCKKKKGGGLPIMEISKHAIKMENSNLSFNKKKHKAILAGTHYQILAILWRWNESHWLIFKTLNSLRDANSEAFLVRKKS